MNLKPMFYRKTLLVSIVTILFLTSCAQIQKVLPDTKPTKVVSYNSLSGRIGEDGPVLVVKIDDTRSARPQIGIEYADVVYIEQVEGGLTRLAAVFSSRIPQRIGPVRSARISDIEIMSQYGKVAFAYSGAQRNMFPVIAAANLQDVGANKLGPIIYPTDPNRIRPYAMVLRADLLLERILEKGYAIDKAKNVGFIFGVAPVGGVATEKVEISWPGAIYSAAWSQLERRWLLTHNRVINTAESGVILGATTLVVQIVAITDSGYGDKFGGVTPLSQTIGSGKAYVLRDGKRFLTTWSRPFADSGTTFTLSDGTQMKFAPGQVWVALTDREPVFTSPPVVETK